MTVNHLKQRSQFSKQGASLNLTASSNFKLRALKTNLKIISVKADFDENDTSLRSLMPSYAILGKCCYIFTNNEYSLKSQM